MDINDMVTFEVNGKKCVALVRKLTEREHANLRILPRRSGKGDTPRHRRQRRREVPPRNVQLSRRMEQRDRHCSQGQFAN